ncbi:MAG: tetratricopeptide repeat protein [Candidatus Melainabacteria bacterium]|nr:tetratricopeptide repeat protein [Candidatus Melainabacteria bacterium]
MKHSRLPLLQYFSKGIAACLILLGSAAPVFGADYTQYQVQDFVGRARALRGKMTAKNAEQMFSVANQLHEQGKGREACEILTVICNSKYANCETLCSLADYSTDQMGESDPSHPVEKILEQAIKLDPKCSRAWTLLADTSFKKGDIAKAIRYSDKSISVSQPKAPYHLAYMVRAAVLAQVERYDEALECVVKAEKPAGYRAELWRIKGSILENLKRYSEAAASYRKAISTSNQSIDWTTFQIVRCLEKQNLNKEAISELCALIKTNPADAEAYRVRASLKVKVNDLNGAIGDLSKVLELEPTTKSYLERAKLYERTGKKELSKKDMQAAEKLKADPF